jgi:5-methylcytosine-specific restriction endonuclease McrA
MKESKKQIRKKFRDSVFSRDNYVCAVCRLPSSILDAHHITNRNLLPNGGYIPENGISLCSDCHLKAETFDVSPIDGYSPEDLYKLINSSLDLVISILER